MVNQTSTRRGGGGVLKKMKWSRVVTWSYMTDLMLTLDFDRSVIISGSVVIKIDAKA
jgi:hypothetical protein